MELLDLSQGPEIADANVRFGSESAIRPGQPNVRSAPKADIREMDILQCDGRPIRPAIGQQFEFGEGFLPVSLRVLHLKVPVVAIS